MCPAVNRRAHNSLWQLTADTWSTLEDATVKPSGAGGKRSVESQVDAISELLRVLEPIERYWAFPGAHAFQELRRMFAAGKYDQFVAAVGRISRALVGLMVKEARAGLPDEPPAHEGEDKPLAFAY